VLRSIVFSASTFAAFSLAPSLFNPAAASDRLEEIVVTTPYERSLRDVLQGSSVISGERLQRELGPTIGETLARLPGVSATSFGPGASRPVLRGLQGERVRVLVNGIGSIDVSNTSPDHAVAGDPILAQRIEVLRGPSTLLFGSSALGGVVNIIDGRIAERMPADPVSGRATALYGTAADEAAFGGRLDAALSPRLVLHASGLWRDTSDLRIGGPAESSILRAAEGEEPASPEEPQRLEGSDLRNKQGTIGLSSIFERGFFGMSVSHLDSNYGVPGHAHAHDDHEDPDHEDHGSDLHAEDEEEAVRIDLVQTRIDLRGGLRFDYGFFESMNLRAGWADYRHEELEGDEIGTRFDNQAWEARLEAVQRVSAGWRGAFGVQALGRDFSAAGEEAYIPPNDTSQVGLFVLQEIAIDAWTLEAAARIERASAEAESINVDRRFHPLSLSAGASYRLDPVWQVGVSLSRSERAPAAEELFANGPHAATRSFEIGDPTFGKERATGVEASIAAETDRASFAVRGYYSSYDGFISEQATGREEDGFPVYEFRQTDASFTGVEIEASYALLRSSSLTWLVDAVADYTRAKDRQRGGPLPRIPAKRLLLGTEAQTELVDARLEAEFVDDQRRVTAFELPTDGYTMLNASLAWRPWGASRGATLRLDARNLTDAEARRHASFLKDLAPLAGRDIRLSAQFTF
jgi:iron complex outermembrane receptor protein